MEKYKHKSTKEKCRPGSSQCQGPRKMLKVSTVFPEVGWPISPEQGACSPARYLNTGSLRLRERPCWLEHERWLSLQPLPPVGFTSHRDSCTCPPSRSLTLTLVKFSLSLAWNFEVTFQLDVFASSVLSSDPAPTLLYNNHLIIQFWIRFSSAPMLPMAPHFL